MAASQSATAAAEIDQRGGKEEALLAQAAAVKVRDPLHLLHTIWQCGLLATLATNRHLLAGVFGCLQVKWQALATAFNFPAELPPRNKCSWDFVLQEAAWLAHDVMQVRSCL